MLSLNKDNFEAEVVKSEIPVIADFWAEWCPPCKIIAPIFEKISSEYKGKLKFAKIDVDKNQDISQKYEVRAIPSLIIFNKGKEVERLVGALKEETLKEKLNEILSKL